MFNIDDGKDKIVIIMCLTIIGIFVVGNIIFKVVDIDRKESNIDKNISNNDNSGELPKNVFRIYASSDESKYQVIAKNGKAYDGYHYVKNYECSDNCYFGDFYFVHEDSSIDIFSEDTGEVKRTTYVKKYDIKERNLEVRKYTLDNKIYYYTEYNDRKSLALEDDDAIVLFLSDETDNARYFLSSSTLLEKNIYGFVDENDSKTQFVIYRDDNIVYQNDKDSSAYGCKLVDIGNLYQVQFYSQMIILDRDFKEVVRYLDSDSKCSYLDGALYCALNNGESKRAELVSYDSLGQENLIKNYKVVLEVNNELTTMGLTNDDVIEVYDIKNNQVIYSFDKLGKNQTPKYTNYFNNYNYYDKEKNCFRMFIYDSSLTQDDFPSDQNYRDSIFGYEYIYNLNTKSGSINKVADFVDR